MIGFALWVQLEIREVIPAVNNEKVFLNVARARVRKEPSPPPYHLPELHPTEHGLGKHQGLNGRNVHASVEHVN
jgi:hypothetical protein